MIQIKLIKTYADLDDLLGSELDRLIGGYGYYLIGDEIWFSHGGIKQLSGYLSGKDREVYDSIITLREYYHSLQREIAAMVKITVYNKTDGNIEFKIGENKWQRILIHQSAEVTNEEYKFIDNKLFENKWLSIDKDQLITVAYNNDASYKMYGEFLLSNLNNLIQHVEAATGSSATTSLTKIEKYNYIVINSNSEERTDRNGLYCFIN